MGPAWYDIDVKVQRLAAFSDGDADGNPAGVVGGMRYIMCVHVVDQTGLASMIPNGLGVVIDRVSSNPACANRALY
jgi:hypothetical protein